MSIDVILSSMFTKLFCDIRKPFQCFIKCRSAQLHVYSAKNLLSVTKLSHKVQGLADNWYCRSIRQLILVSDTMYVLRRHGYSSYITKVSKYPKEWAIEQ